MSTRSQRLPSLNGLKVFWAAARHGSFAKAADELHVTPSAVSLQVRQLEDELGLKLFDRTARGLALTPSGQRVLPDVASAFERLQQSFAALRDADRATMLTVSAAHRQGIDDLLEEVVARLPEEGAGELLDEDPARMRIAFVGRPNVGKSTLVNRLLGEERMIASEVPGTTRDSIAVDLERDGRQYRLIDTAGLRRRSKVEEAVEKFSAFKTLQAIEQCQVAVLMLDANEGVTDQDATVLGAILEAGKALVVAINKWDGLTDYQREQAEDLLSRKLGFVNWAEAVRISAKHGSGLRELFRAVHRAHASATREFGTAEVNKTLEVAYETNPPPSIRGHVSKLRYVHPGGSNPPTFIVHGTRLKVLPDSYKRYLENFFRKRFKLVGTPVRFIFREGANPYEGKKNVLTEKQIAKKRRLIRHVKRGK